MRRSSRKRTLTCPVAVTTGKKARGRARSDGVGQAPAQNQTQVQNQVEALARVQKHVVPKLETPALVPNIVVAPAAVQNPIEAPRQIDGASLSLKNLYTDILAKESITDMQQYEDKLCNMSMELNSAFDVSRFSENVRQFKYTIEPIMEILRCKNDKGVGSHQEGTNLDDSDTDFLRIDQTGVKVEYNPQDVGQDSETPYLCLTRAHKTPAGYTKLQIYQNGKPCSENDIVQIESHFNHEICATDMNNVFLINRRNSKLTEKDTALGFQNHGPASTYKTNLNLTYDIVLAYESLLIPKEMKSWFERTRLKSWPSKIACNRFKSMGCYYVGVGHSKSPEQNMEWRISPTRQELYLMINLNPTQFRCYNLLKMIRKKYIQNQFGDVISSYHCKTALFYTIENNDISMWQPYNLISCVLKCLMRLLDWIASKKCPNYFIPEENMFESKLIEWTQKEKLHDTFDNIVRNFSRIQNQLLSIIGNCKKDSDVIWRCLIRLKIRISYDVSSAVRQNAIFKHHIKLIQSNPRDSLKVFQGIVAPYEINLGILLELLKERLINLNRIERVHSSIEHRSNDTDTYLQDDSRKSLEYYECCLKLASLAAKLGYTLKCDAILQTLCKKPNKVNVMCNCYSTFSFAKTNVEHGNNISRFVLKNVTENITLAGKRMNQFFIKDILQQFTLCLPFDDREYEAGIVMTPLHLDAFKTVGIPSNMLIRSERLYSYEDLISIHPITYKYFLQYKNSWMLSKKCDMCVALEKLECINLVSLQKGIYTHADTIINLLGHIYLTKGWNRLSLQCFRRIVENVASLQCS